MQSYVDCLTLNQCVLNQCYKSEFAEEVILLKPLLLIIILNSVNLFDVGHNTYDYVNWNFSCIVNQ